MIVQSIGTNDLTIDDIYACNILSFECWIIFYYSNEHVLSEWLIIRAWMSNRDWFFAVNFWRRKKQKRKKTRERDGSPRSSCYCCYTLNYQSIRFISFSRFSSYKLCHESCDQISSIWTIRIVWILSTQ